MEKAPSHGSRQERIILALTRFQAFTMVRLASSGVQMQICGSCVVCKAQLSGKGYSFRIPQTDCKLLAAKGPNPSTALDLHLGGCCKLKIAL